MTVTLDGVSHQRARVNGVELHWVEKGDGPLVLLMHGFPEFWWSWRKQIGPLSRQFRIVAVDMRGFNESEKPATGYDTATLATDMRDLIDRLGGPAYVAGHDWGGIVAYQLAMDWPDRVRKLAILNAPHPDAWIRAWLTHAEQQRKSWYVFLNLLPDFPEENYKAQFRDGTIRLARVMPPEDVAVYREAFEKPGTATAALNYYREIVKEIPRRRHVTPGRITCPVRVLWGRRDIALDPVVNDIAAPWIDTREVFYFPAAWHWIAFEKPRAVTRHLREFFDAP
ncbi:MAG: alpha/beta fold hydrolase [Rhodospirillaceae bacterium]|nr:alpha/beta fold hydrolase [Rhodospirillaceae bacterium]